MLLQNLSKKMWLEHGVLLVQFRHPVIDPRNLDMLAHLATFLEGNSIQGTICLFFDITYIFFHIVKFVLHIDFEVLKNVFIDKIRT